MRAVSGISRRSWLKLTRWTVFGTLGCIAISIAFNCVYFWNEPSNVFAKSLISAAAIPIILAGPLFFYLTLKLRELAIANHRLTHLASIDSLTGCLNRGAFTRLIDGFLEGGSSHLPSGALLVIDADHFKSINDRFGHHCGDAVLNLMADAIRVSLRKGDWLGRLGGEEFGVFLPDTDLAEASRVAERIRRRIHALGFTADGVQHELSVSIGGAAFDRQTTFADLFRIADERLYVAKKAGRDRIEMTRMSVQSFTAAVARVMH